MFAAMSVGVVVAPISPNYSLMPGGLARLQDIATLLRPAFVFVQDSETYSGARTIPELASATWITADQKAGSVSVQSLYSTRPGAEFEQAFRSIDKEAAAKLYEQIAPYADRCTSILTGSACLGSNHSYLGLLSYKTQQYTLAGEFVSTKTAAITGSIISAFGVYHFTNSKAAVIARVDIVDPDRNVGNNKNTRIIAGASYQLSPNVRLLADLDRLSFESGATATNQVLFQTQFTF